MRRGRQGASLADRAVWSGVAQPAEPPVSGGRSGHQPSEDGHGRHCWVRDPPEEPGIWPGLLVEWRQREDGWQRRVAYTLPGEHGPVFAEAWLPADQLKAG